MHRKNELEDIVVMFFPPVLFDDVVDTHTTSTKRGGKSSLFLFNQPEGEEGRIICLCSIKPRKTMAS